MHEQDLHLWLWCLYTVAHIVSYIAWAGWHFVEMETIKVSTVFDDQLAAAEGHRKRLIEKKEQEALSALTLHPHLLLLK